MDEEERTFWKELRSNLFSVISDVAGVAFSLYVGYTHKLFIEVSGVNTPWVSINFTEKYPWLKVDFDINTLTVTVLIVLIASIICAWSSVIHLWVTLSAYHPSVKRKYKRLQILGFVTVIIGWIVEILDFISSIGPGSYD
jgi:hypothetical protein